MAITVIIMENITAITMAKKRRKKNRGEKGCVSGKIR